MTYEEEQEILDRFKEAADAGQIITVKEIKSVFDEKLGKDTGSGYIYMLLARHGYVCSDIEFAEEAQTSFALHFRLFPALADRLTCA